MIYVVDKVNDATEMKNITNSLESKLPFENKYIRKKIIFYELIVKTALKEETLRDRNFHSLAVFEPSGESLCPRKFSKLVIYESLWLQN